MEGRFFLKRHIYRFFRLTFGIFCVFAEFFFTKLFFAKIVSAKLRSFFLAFFPFIPFCEKTQNFATNFAKYDMKILAFFRESFCSLETLKIYKIELEFVVRNQFFCLCFNFNSWNNLEEYVEDIMDEDIIRVNRNISEESESLASVLTPGNSNFVQYILTNLRNFLVITLRQHAHRL